MPGKRAGDDALGDGLGGGGGSQSSLPTLTVTFPTSFAGEESARGGEWKKDGMTQAQQLQLQAQTRRPGEVVGEVAATNGGHHHPNPSAMSIAMNSSATTSYPDPYSINIVDKIPELEDEGRCEDHDSSSSMNGSSKARTHRVGNESPKSPEEEDSQDGGVVRRFRTQFRAVKYVKYIVILILVVLTVVSTVLVGFFLKKEESDDFAMEYYNLASKVSSAFHHNLDMKVYSAYTLTAMIVREGTMLTAATAGAATGSNVSVAEHWPNVTVVSFQDQTAGIIPLSHARWVGFGPLLTDDQRKAWEQYAAETADAMGFGTLTMAEEDHSNMEEDGGGDHSSMEMAEDHSNMDMDMNSTEHNNVMGHATDTDEHDDSSAHTGAMDDQDVANMEHDMGSEEETTMGQDGSAMDHLGSDGHGTASMDGHGTASTTEGGDGVTAAHTSMTSNGTHASAMIGEDSRTAENEMEDMASEFRDEAPWQSNGGGRRRYLRTSSGSGSGSGGTGKRTSSRDRELQGGGHGSIMNGMDPLGHGHSAGEASIQPQRPTRKISDGIYKLDGKEPVDDHDHDAPYLLPLWQIAPMLGNEAGVMFNQYSEATRRHAIDGMIRNGVPALTEVLHRDVDHHPDDEHHLDPSSMMFYPIMDQFGATGGDSIVGAVSISFSWASMFHDVLQTDTRGMIVVLESSSGHQQTFEIDGTHASFVGMGDLHQQKYSGMCVTGSYVVTPVETFKDGHAHMNHRRSLEMSGHSGSHGGDFESAVDSYADDHSVGHGGDDDAVSNRTGLVSYTIRVYPSDEFRAKYESNNSVVFPMVIALVFFFTSATFLIYNCLVERRQSAVMDTAVKSSRIVHNLFPAVVRDRLLNKTEEEEEQEEAENNKGIKRLLPRTVTSIVEAPTIQTFLARKQYDFADESTTVSGSIPPIADLFTDTTILFADIAGFTAWSSEREPTQVFLLLEALFKEFDTEAKVQGVFKVETIGDCYVAVTGLPEPNPNHAVVMTRFAQVCLKKFQDLTKELELSLGPGTAELGMRFGLHSGPVTAGVLRGAKSRFQLFGDTMNTASRMESTGQKDRIQVSQATAKLLIAAGKERILVPREGLVQAKGKGSMQTYWVRPRGYRTSSYSSQLSLEDDVPTVEEAAAPLRESAVLNAIEPREDEAGQLRPGSPRGSIQQKRRSSRRSYKLNDSGSWIDTGLGDHDSGVSGPSQPSKHVQRLITWNAAVLEKCLAEVMMHRNLEVSKKTRSSRFSKSSTEASTDEHTHIVAEAVESPRFDRKYATQLAKTRSCRSSRKKMGCLPNEARKELHSYVTRVASTYKKSVHFHNFEHASHVTMSANKLMNKVCSRDWNDNSGKDGRQEVEKSGEKGSATRNREAGLFFSTFGINSDPLAQLAVVFAALIHDVDHEGVPNVRLVQEKPDLAKMYDNTSVAENNSIDVAWSILMEPEFENLRQCMFANEDEDVIRFRQLLINLLIATDIADGERRGREKIRWEKAFSNIETWEEQWQNKSDEELGEIDVSLKATVVLEQIMLASDVAHTMQHWLTFVKWNERLYRELWAAYQCKRSEKDPTIGWYEGQIGFFDGYIIPLASKLKECGVFGTAGDEYLGNALSNRQEWTEKGKEISARFDATIKEPSLARRSSTMSDKPHPFESH